MPPKKKQRKNNVDYAFRNRRWPKKKNKGRRNPRKVILRSIQLEVKQRARRIEHQNVEARVRQVIADAPWQSNRGRNPELKITRRLKYKDKVFVSTRVKLRRHPVRLVEAQVVQALQEAEPQVVQELQGAELVDSSGEEYSYYSDEQGGYLEEPYDQPEPQPACSSEAQAASSSGAQAASSSGRQGRVKPEPQEYDVACEYYEEQRELEDLDKSRKEKTQSEDEYTYVYTSSASEGSETARPSPTYCLRTQSTRRQCLEPRKEEQGVQLPPARPGQ